MRTGQLWRRGSTLSFEQLGELSGAIANAIYSSGPVRERVCILSDRTSTAYAGIVGAMVSDCTYVPLDPRFPVQKNRRILEASGAKVSICDERHRRLVSELVAGLPHNLRNILPES